MSGPSDMDIDLMTRLYIQGWNDGVSAKSREGIGYSEWYLAGFVDGASLRNKAHRGAETRILNELRYRKEAEAEDARSG